MNLKRYGICLMLYATCFTLYGQTFARDRLIVKLKPDIDIYEIILPHIIKDIEQIIKDPHPNALAKELGLHLLYLLYFDETKNIQQVIRDCQASGLFEYVEPDYVYAIDSNQSFSRVFPITKQLNLIPNDPYYSSQWYLQKIGCPMAWDSVQGSPDYTVAIIDLGVNYLHEDLSATYAGGYDFYSNDTIPLPNSLDPWAQCMLASLLRILITISVLPV
ncbi:MAG: hypothetical protein KGZ86_05405 [Candidatus Latescibacteria bacterium]|nr:hypothetical protein [Candidatus Latescibacterota bacterium]